MQQYISHLLVVVVGTSATFILSPCQAQTPVKTNSQNTDNISSTSLNSPSAIPLSDFANSTNSNPNSKTPILSEAINNSSTANANITATKPQPRLPIFSRIFRTPLMQQ